MDGVYDFVTRNVLHRFGCSKVSINNYFISPFKAYDQIGHGASVNTVFHNRQKTDNI